MTRYSTGGELGFSVLLDGEPFAQTRSAVRAVDLADQLNRADEIEAAARAVLTSADPRSRALHSLANALDGPILALPLNVFGNRFLVRNRDGKAIASCLCAGLTAERVAAEIVRAVNAEARLRKFVVDTAAMLANPNYSFSERVRRVSVQIAVVLEEPKP